MQSYSKGARGLSVLPRGDCIFTNTSTSLSLGRRQCGHRYAIRAGRNLPDKEFRYLRTVIVTAAVYRGFDQELAPHHLTFRHRAGVTPYTSTFVFAECCVFVKQSQPPISLQPLSAPAARPSPTRGTPYPEVTVSICRVPSPEFSQAPENIHLAHLCRFAVRSLMQLKLRGFSWKQGITHFGAPRASRYHASTKPRGFAYAGTPTRLNRDIQHPAGITFSVPPSHCTIGTGILTCFPSATPFVPHLRGRLTLRR